MIGHDLASACLENKVTAVSFYVSGSLANQHLITVSEFFFMDS